CRGSFSLRDDLRALRAGAGVRARLSVLRALRLRTAVRAVRRSAVLRSLRRAARAALSALSAVPVLFLLLLRSSGDCAARAAARCQSGAAPERSACGAKVKK